LSANIKAATTSSVKRTLVSDGNAKGFNRRLLAVLVSVMVVGT
jgi:hypothetical protein